MYWLTDFGFRKDLDICRKERKASYNESRSQCSFAFYKTMNISTATVLNLRIQELNLQLPILTLGLLVGSFLSDDVI